MSDNEQKLNELLDRFLTQVTENYDGEEPEEFLRSSLNKVLAGKKQGAGFVSKQQVEFFIDEGDSLPLYPIQYEEE